MRSESPSTTRSLAPDPQSGGQPPVAFNLDGPSRKLDKRAHAYRADIADIALAGILFAPHYAAPLMKAATATTMMRSAADAGAEAVSQLLPGEPFAVLDITGAWAWGYSVHDHYVGFVAHGALGDPIEATHCVAVREALLFSGESIKSPAIASLPFGSRIRGEEGDAFVQTDAGFIHKRHLRPIALPAADPVAVAELYLGAPYLWGGRGAGGIDCSGLVQMACAAAGINAPRDTDQQRVETGDVLPEGSRLRRGDMIHFPGHVGLMVNETDLIHANAHWMSVVIEPLADVVTRLQPHHDRPILCRRRMTI